MLALAMLEGQRFLYHGSNPDNHLIRFL